MFANQLLFQAMKFLTLSKKRSTSQANISINPFWGVIYSFVPVFILPFCFMIGFVACTGKETTTQNHKEDEKMPLVIQISDALLHPQQEILLSELADSVSYIPLETKKKCLLGNHPTFSFTSHYIVNCNYCFDWSGKFRLKVGKSGQGPGEEPSELINKVTFCKDNFYTCGQKIIEYDSVGIFTGKEVSLYTVNKTKGILSNKSLAWIVDIHSINGNLVLYNYPDTVFFVNKNLEFIHKRSIMPWGKESSPFFLSLGSSFDKYMTKYKGSILFYNYFRDTVFQISGTDFNPRWIVKLDKLKLSEEVLYNFDELYGRAKKDYDNNQLETTPLVKLMDHKYMITSVYESNKYVFIIASEIIAFKGLRHIPHSSPILICYNKKTKEIKSTLKIRDDLSGYPDFFPRFGLAGEKMIDSFWPYEKEDWLKEKAKSDPCFFSFAKRDFSEDNPIIIVAHLKKF